LERNFVESAIMLGVLGIILFLGLVSARPQNLTEDPLIRNDWATLRDKVTIRLFSPGDYFKGGDEFTIWQEMGKDIDCIVHDDLKTEVFPPENFNPDLPTKLMTHGFASNATDGKTNFVNAWMQNSAKDVNVILVDWSGLAGP